MNDSTRLVAVAVLAFFLFMLFRSLRLLRQAMASTGPRWESTDGEIIQSEIRRRRRSYAAIVRYRYSVGGRDYVSHRVSFTETLWTNPWEAHARRIVEEYPVGRRVTVGYDREDPRCAVLEIGIPPRLTGQILLAAVFVAVAAGLVWLSL